MSGGVGWRQQVATALSLTIVSAVFLMSYYSWPGASDVGFHSARVRNYARAAYFFRKTRTYFNVNVPYYGV